MSEGLTNHTFSQEGELNPGFGIPLQEVLNKFYVSAGLFSIIRICELTGQKCIILYLIITYTIFQTHKKKRSVGGIVARFYSFND